MLAPNAVFQSTDGKSGLWHGENERVKPMEVSHQAWVEGHCGLLLMWFWLIRFTEGDAGC